MTDEDRVALRRIELAKRLVDDLERRDHFAMVEPKPGLEHEGLGRIGEKRVVEELRRHRGHCTHSPGEVMTTEFSYEHVFRAPSPRTVIDAYFDPGCLATQDQVAELGDRVVTE